MGAALGYIRRSRVSVDRPGAVSHEAQTTAVRALAARHGYKDLRILEDWGRSGGAGKEGARTAYQELRAAVRAGTVSDVFAYDQSRLTRSTIEWANLVAACREHHVRVHLVNGGTKDFDSVDGRLTADILASIAQAERERGQERGALTIAHRNARGDRLGAPRYGWCRVGKGHEGEVMRVPGEDPATVVGAFREAGTFQGAARLLNARHVPTKFAGYGKARGDVAPTWRASAVRRIVGREAPELIPRGTRPGAPTVSHYRLAGLLRCDCGGILTGAGRGAASVIYRCARAYSLPDHATPKSIAEAALRPWIEAEAARFRYWGREAEEAAATEERADLIAQRERLALAYARGGLPEPVYTAEDSALVDRLEALPAAPEVADIGPVTDLWTWAPADANTTLRLLWEYVKLGPDMRPIVAEWRNKALRAD